MVGVSGHRMHIINEDSVSVHQVAEHLRRYGLETKPPEVLDNARVLGLQLSRQLPGRKLWWARGNTIPEVDSLTDMSRKELFSICGKLVGHYPVVGWLRVACSYIKRHAGGSAWDDKIGNRPLAWIKEVVKRVQSSDPVQGVWFVPADRPGRVWCDASSLAIGVALDIDGQTVEDACWLRKKDDSAHINVAELDAVLRGVNMALKWQMKEIVLVTDSATVRSWLTSILSGSHRIRTSGIAEMLVRRRLSMIDDLKNEYDLVMHVELVSSAKNKADVLTRVPQVWLKNEIQQSVVAMHERHHFGVERTLHLAQQVDPTVTRKEVEMVVAACRECKSIDPAPVRWEHGELNVKSHWQRVAADVTHFGRERYLTLVDCGPSRFAIWRRIRSEEVSIVSAIFEEIFRERGPPEELLLDNSSTFRSRQLAQVCETWNVRRVFRCALRPAGNGIIERHHRTIKRQAARSGKNPLDIVFWYNMAPLSGTSNVVPAAMLFKYDWRNPDVRDNSLATKATTWKNKHRVGDRVFVKPARAKCTTRWPMGLVTAVPSATQVEVDWMPRHVADCRSADRMSDTSAGAVEEEETTEEETAVKEGVVEPLPARYSGRDRRPPTYLKDYFV